MENYLDLQTSGDNATANQTFAKKYDANTTPKIVSCLTNLVIFIIIVGGIIGLNWLYQVSLDHNTHDLDSTVNYASESISDSFCQFLLENDKIEECE